MQKKWITASNAEELGRRKIQTWEDEENARGKEQSSKLAED
jgi:hypothetical protein